MLGTLHAYGASANYHQPDDKTPEPTLALNIINATDSDADHDNQPNPYPNIPFPVWVWTTVGGVAQANLSMTITINRGGLTVAVTANGGWTINITPGETETTITATKATEVVGTSAFNLEVTHPLPAGQEITFSGSVTSTQVTTPATDVEVVTTGEEPATWDVDATSGIAVPADATQWNAFISGNGLSISSPSHLWLCQEASGNLADAIGAVALTAGGSPNYQVPRSGWTRVGVHLDTGSSDEFISGSTPNVTNTSQLWLFFVSLGATQSTGYVIGGPGPNGSTSGLFATHLATTGALRFRCTSNVADTANSYSSTSPFPLVYKYDRTNSVCRGYTASEKVSPTYGTTGTHSGGGMGHNAAGGSANAVFVYAAVWTGAAAEMSDADLKALLQAMGWTISWS